MSYSSSLRVAKIICDLAVLQIFSFRRTRFVFVCLLLSFIFVSWPPHYIRFVATSLAIIRNNMLSSCDFSEKITSARFKWVFWGIGYI
jgi:hypothetical protein